MAWVKYNKDKHGQLGKLPMRVITWEELCGMALAGTKCKQISIGTCRVNKTGIDLLRRSSMITHKYHVDGDQLKFRNFDGWSTFVVPSDWLEVLEAEPKQEKTMEVDYNTQQWQRCDFNTLICPHDFVRIVTKSTLVGEGKAKIGQFKDVQITSDRKILSSDGKVKNRIDDGEWKKMRAGERLFAQDISKTNHHVTLHSTYGQLFKIPFEYLEISPRGDKNGNRQKAQRKEIFYGKDKIKDAMAELKKQKQTEQPTTTTETKDTKMEAKFNAQQIMDQNKDALLVAAKIEVGEAAVKQVSKIIKGQLPLMVKGYAELPIFDILVANMVVMAIKQFAPDNEKANIIADAMLLAAMQKQMKEFNIPGMIEEFVSGIDVTAITKLDAK